MRYFSHYSKRNAGCTIIEKWLIPFLSSADINIEINTE